MKKFINLILVFCVLISISGCASLKGNVPFGYQPSLVSTSRTIDKSVGINILVDRRPEKDGKYTKNIKDVSEKVTSKFIEDITSSNIFNAINYPASQDDDITINGTLDRFKWKLYAKPITYIPYIGLIAMIVGVETTEAYGIAGITIEVKDNKTGTVITTISKNSEIHTSYNAYNFQAGEAGSELAEALRAVVKEIKSELLTNIK